MGKAIIILVLAAGIVVAYGAMSSHETAHYTAKNQANYEENVLAREIARSGFNAAMAILRLHGDDLQGGVNAVNGQAGYFQGEHLGGIYRAEARFLSGTSVEVISHGYFGGTFNAAGTYENGVVQTIEDSFTYDLPRTPLHASQCSSLEVDVVDSQTAYCSAVYMVRYLPGQETPLNPELVFPSGRNRDGVPPGVSFDLASGTQLNLFIGVDKNCSLAPLDPNPSNYDYENHVFNASNYDHIHNALNVTSPTPGGVTEAIWAIVDQHPSSNQRWRVAWEDEHNWNITNNKHGHFSDPTLSLIALKMFGYDNAGWPVTDARGYRALQTHSGRPDLSDQVLDITMHPQPCDTGEGGDGGDGGGDDGGGDDGGGEEPGSSADCIPCPLTDQSRIMHRPPGNPANESEICVGPTALPGHLEHHDDYMLCPASN